MRHRMTNSKTAAAEAAIAVQPTEHQQQPQRQQHSESKNTCTAGEQYQVRGTAEVVV